MADRGISSNLKTYLQAATSLIEVTLVDITLGSTTYYYNTSPYSISYGGNTYVPKAIVNISNLSEKGLLSNRKTTIIISAEDGSDADVLSLDSHISEEFFNKELVIRKGFWVDNGLKENEAILIFKGRITSANYSKSDNSWTATYNAEDLMGSDRTYSGRILDQDSNAAWLDASETTPYSSDYGLTWAGKFYHFRQPDYFVEQTRTNIRPTESGGHLKRLFGVHRGVELIETTEKVPVEGDSYDINFAKVKLPVVYGTTKVKGIPIFAMFVKSLSNVTSTSAPLPIGDYLDIDTFSQYNAASTGTGLITWSKVSYIAKNSTEASTLADAYETEVIEDWKNYFEAEGYTNVAGTRNKLNFTVIDQPGSMNKINIIGTVLITGNITDEALDYKEAVILLALSEGECESLTETYINGKAFSRLNNSSGDEAKEDQLLYDSFIEDSTTSQRISFFSGSSTQTIPDALYNISKSQVYEAVTYTGFDFHDTDTDAFPDVSTINDIFLKDTCYVMLRVKMGIGADNNKDYFKDLSFIDNIEFLLKGKEHKGVYSGGISTNAATVADSSPVNQLVDYLIDDRYGANITSTDIDHSSFNTTNTTFSADDSRYTETGGSKSLAILEDKFVQDDDGTTTYWHRLGRNLTWSNATTNAASNYNTYLSTNWVCDTNKSVISNINYLVEQLNSRIIFANGKYYLKHKRVTSSSVHTFDKTNIIGSIGISENHLTERFNRINISYNNSTLDEESSGSYNISRFNSTYQSNDGRKHEMSRKYNSITNYYIAERLGLEELAASRANLKVNLTAPLNTIWLEVGDKVTVDDTDLWASSVDFLIDEINFNNNGTINYKLVKYDDTVFTGIAASSDPAQKANYRAGNPLSVTPSAPQSVLVKYVDNKFTKGFSLSWVAPAVKMNVSGYVVEIYDYSTSNWIEIKKIESSLNTSTFINTKKNIEGLQFQFRVASYRESAGLYNFPILSAYTTGKDIDSNTTITVPYFWERKLSDGLSDLAGLGLDVTYPKPTGLTTERKRSDTPDGEYTGKGPVFKWNPVVPYVDSKELDSTDEAGNYKDWDVKYHVTILNGNTVVYETGQNGVAHVSDNIFHWTHDLAINSKNKKPFRTITINVSSIGDYGQESGTAVHTVTNTAPVAPANLITSVDKSRRGFLISWDKNTDLDLAGTVVWISNTSDPTPSSTTYLGQVSSNRGTFLVDKYLSNANLVPGQTYYIKVAHFDDFLDDTDIKAGTGLNTTSATITNALPSAPASISSTTGLKYVEVSFDASTDEDWKGTLIWMSTTSGFTPSSSNLVADIQDTRTTILIDKTSINGSDLSTNTTYYYKVAHYDSFSLGYSTAKTDREAATYLTLSSEQSASTFVIPTYSATSTARAIDRWSSEIRATFSVSNDRDNWTHSIRLTDGTTRVYNFLSQGVAGSNDYNITDLSPGRTVTVAVLVSDDKGYTATGTLSGFGGAGSNELVLATESSLTLATPTTPTLTATKDSIYSGGSLSSTVVFTVAFTWTQGSGPFALSFRVIIENTTDSTDFYEFYIPANDQTDINTYSESFNARDAFGKTWKAKVIPIGWDGNVGTASSYSTNTSALTEELKTASSGARIELSSTELGGYSTSVQTFKIDATDGSCSFGSGASAVTVNSAGTLTVPNDAIITNLSSKIIDVSSAGYIHSGKTTGTDTSTAGFILGYDSVTAGTMLYAGDGAGASEGYLKWHSATGDFHVGTSSTYLQWDNSEGDLNIVGGQLNVNGIKLGKDVDAGNTEDGLFFDSNNYWYSDTTNGGFDFKVGDSTAYLRYDSSVTELTLEADKTSQAYKITNNKTAANVNGILVDISNATSGYAYGWANLSTQYGIRGTQTHSSSRGVFLTVQGGDGEYIECTGSASNGIYVTSTATSSDCIHLNNNTGNGIGLHVNNTSGASGVYVTNPDTTGSPIGIHCLNNSTSSTSVGILADSSSNGVAMQVDANSASSTALDISTGQLKIQDIPAFRAYLSSGQTNVTGNNVEYKLQFNTENFDNNSDYDNSTNYRFDVPVNGFYYFHSSVMFDESSSGIQKIQLKIYKNGSLAGQVDSLTPVSGTEQSIQISLFDKSASGDYFEIKILGASGTQVVDITGGSDYTWFEGYMISAY